MKIYQFLVTMALSVAFTAALAVTLCRMIDTDFERERRRKISRGVPGAKLS